MGRTELLVRGVLVRDRHVLLAMHKGKKHVFLPGGHIEFAEAAHQALVREMKEETGLTIRVGRFLGAVEHTWKDKKRIHAEVNLLFTMSCASIRRRSAPDSREKKIVFLWHHLNDLRSTSLEPSILRVLLPWWIKTPPTEQWASTYNR